jgi:hypothetical protein
VPNDVIVRGARSGLDLRTIGWSPRLIPEQQHDK